MKNTEIIANHLDYIKSEECYAKQCLICGKETTRYSAAKKIINSDRFTNLSLCKGKSDVICDECVCCLKEAKLRHSCFYADTEKIYFFKKNDIEDFIFDFKPAIPFVFCVTQSFKKHNSFKAKVNYDTNEFTIQSEDVEFTFNKKHKHLYEMLSEAYLLFTKEEMKTGRYVSLVDVAIISAYENEFKKHRGKAYYDFLIWILNSEKRNETVKEKREQEKKNGQSRTGKKINNSTLG